MLEAVAIVVTLTHGRLEEIAKTTKDSRIKMRMKLLRNYLNQLEDLQCMCFPPLLRN